MYIVIPTGFLYSIKWIQKTTFIKINLHQHYSKKLAVHEAKFRCRCLEDCEERVLELDALLVCQANNVRLMLNPKFDSSLGWVHRVFDTISWHNRCPQDTMSITLCNNNISHPLHSVIVTIGRRKEQSIVRNYLLLNIFNIYYYYYYHHHNNRYWQYLMKYLRKVNTQTMMNHSSLWMCYLTKLN